MKLDQQQEKIILDLARDTLKHYMQEKEYISYPKYCLEEDDGTDQLADFLTKNNACFVTLKKDLAYMRVGPGREYPLDWVYVRQNLPLKVISEFDVWRKVVDHEGTTGWLHSSLLSLERYGLVTKAEIKLHASAEESSDVVAIAGRNVLLEVQYCDGQWCRLAGKEVRGWTERQNFWGVLDNENIE